MIEIDIFEENHRFSEQTPHPALRSVVGAAKLDASIREERYGKHRSTAQCHLLL
jgi:hypothetical protein